MHTLRLGTGLLLPEVASSSTEATGPPRIHAAAVPCDTPYQPFTFGRNGCHSPETAVHLKPKRLFTFLRNGRSFSPVVHTGRRTPQSNCSKRRAPRTPGPPLT